MRTAYCQACSFSTAFSEAAACNIMQPESCSNFRFCSAIVDLGPHPRSAYRQQAAGDYREQVSPQTASNRPETSAPSNEW